MKRFALSVAAASLALSMSTLTPAPAAAQSSGGGAQPVIQECRDVVGELPQVNLGRCMGFNLSSEYGFLTFICMTQRLLDPIAFDDQYATFGECVRYEHSIGPEPAP